MNYEYCVPQIQNISIDCKNIYIYIFYIYIFLDLLGSETEYSMCCKNVLPVNNSKLHLQIIQPAQFCGLVSRAPLYTVQHVAFTVA